MSRPEPLSSLGALRTFESAARLLSFRAAADELGVTQSAVSHQIGSLEDSLSVKLFERRTRQVVLTDAGELFHPFCRDAFERIARGTPLLRHLKGTGTLVVETYATLLVRWLLPRLPAFRALSPELSIRFGASQSDWELRLDDADLGMFWTLRPERAGHDYMLLVKARLVPVCSPDMAESAGVELTPAGIGAMPRLLLHTAPGDWEAWFQATGTEPSLEEVTLEFDTYLSAIEFALRGQGVALVPHFLVTDDLANGRLRVLSETIVEQPGAWYLVHRSDGRADPRIRAFSRWLVEEIGRSETPSTPGPRG